MASKRAYRPVHITFWHSPSVIDLNVNEKLLFLYLLTCPQSHSLGAYLIQKRYMTFETGLNITEVNNALDSLTAKGIVSYDEDANVIFIKKYIEFNPPLNPKHFLGMLDQLHSLPMSKHDRELVLILIPYCKQYSIQFAKPSIIQYRYKDLALDLERDLDLEREVGRIALTFPAKDGNFLLTEERLMEYKKNYPGLDVLSRLGQSAQYAADCLRDGRGYTVRGMPNYIRNQLDMMNKNKLKTVTTSRDCGRAAADAVRQSSCWGD